MQLTSQSRHLRFLLNKGTHMKTRLSLLSLVACIGISLTAHASILNEAIIGGTFTPSGTFSGSFLIDSSSYLIDGATITAMVGSNTYNFFSAVNTSSTPGEEILTDGHGDTFNLLINANSGLGINTVTNCSGCSTSLILASGAPYEATGGSIVTPEPSSLLLLGTGALGLAGSFRRRFLKA